MPKGIYKPFTAADLNFIRDNYLNYPYKTLGRMLGVGGTRIKKTIARMGLVVPDHVVEQRRRDSFYKKGDIPSNKGKKIEEFMSPDAIERSKKGRFKKGNEPHNTKYDGCISIRKEHNSDLCYKYIRVNKAEWRLLQRHVWEKETGETLKTHEIISFKDGDQMNCVFENLKKISREENMLTNSKHDLPEELVPTMALNSKLNKLINTKSDQK